MRPRARFERTWSALFVSVSRQTTSPESATFVAPSDEPERLYNEYFRPPSKCYVILSKTCVAFSKRTSPSQRRVLPSAADPPCKLSAPPHRTLRIAKQRLHSPSLSQRIPSLAQVKVVVVVQGRRIAGVLEAVVRVDEGNESMKVNSPNLAAHS